MRSYRFSYDHLSVRVRRVRGDRRLHVRRYALTTKQWERLVKALLRTPGTARRNKDGGMTVCAKRRV
jgi:hypothetical protein